MDKAAFVILQAELQGRNADVERIIDRIAARKPTYSASTEGVESMAYQLHNLYGAYEQLFEEVARSFENQIDTGRYHSDLLRRMGLQIEGIRPALLSRESAEMLDELRRFRHFFRHAYTVDLEPAKVADIVAKVPGVRDRFARDMAAFLSKLCPP